MLRDLFGDVRMLAEDTRPDEPRHAPGLAAAEDRRPPLALPQRARLRGRLTPDGLRRHPVLLRRRLLRRRLPGQLHPPRARRARLRRGRDALRRPAPASTAAPAPPPARSTRSSRTRAHAGRAAVPRRQRRLLRRLPARRPRAAGPRGRRSAGCDRPGPFRVAVVGAGPAGLYTADELLKHPEVSVDVFDRLPTPYGLVRAGVAPDHQHTKQVRDAVRRDRGAARVPLPARRRGRPRRHATTELAAALRRRRLRRRRRADRRLGIPGEDLPGSLTATDLVGWYNGHPDRQDLARPARPRAGGRDRQRQRRARRRPDPHRRPRASSPAPTSPPARWAALAGSARARGGGARPPRPRRRGLHAARAGRPGRPGEASTSWSTPAARRSPRPGSAGRLLRELAGREPTAGPRTHRAALPRRARRADRSARARVDRRRGGARRRTRRSRPGSWSRRRLPRRSRCRACRTTTRPAPCRTTGAGWRPGSYVAGWVKRGPTGFIGTNKSCAQETVARSSTTSTPAGPRPRPTDRQSHGPARASGVSGRSIVDGWRAIDREERRRGAAAGRPRTKIVTLDELRATATSRLRETV